MSQATDQPLPAPLVATTREAATALRTNEVRIRELVRDGILGNVPVKRRELRIPWADIQRLVEQGTATP